MSSLALVLAASVSGATLVLPAAPAAPAGDLATASVAGGHGIVCTAAAPAASRSVLRAAAWTEHVPGWTETVHPERVETVPAWTETVRDAWTERVLVTPAHTVEREVSPAYEKTVVDREAWVETIDHPAETHTVEHPAVTETHWVFRQKNGNGERTVTDQSSFPGNGWVLVREEQVVVRAAEVETVVDREAWTETIPHEAETHVERYDAVTETVEVPEEWAFVDHPAETVTHPARTITHAAVTIDHPARTIEHPAVVEEVPGDPGAASCVAAADPADPADPAVPASAVLAATGSDAAGLAAGALGAVGLGLVALGAAHLARHASRGPGGRRR